jgi:hypothetical protein
MCFIVKRSSSVRDHFKIKKTICFIGSGLDIYVMFWMHLLNHKVNTLVERVTRDCFLWWEGRRGTHVMSSEVDQT